MRIARGSGFLLLLPCLWLGCEEDTSGGYGPRYEHYGGALSVTCTPSASGGAAGASARVSSPLFVPGDASRPPLKALDCGANGVAIENAGPPANRVNYVILGDGYDQRAVGSVFLGHIARDMRKRFSDPVGQPYGRYRKFVNICALQVASEHNGIGNGPTAFSCSGNDSTRLSSCDTRAAEAALDQLLPESFEVDWRAILLNTDRSWGTGASWALWSAVPDDAPGVALHEGGHSFHQLADEYTDVGEDCGEYPEVNTTADALHTNGKWEHWLGFDAADATGVQCVFQGSAMCRFGEPQYRSSQNSMMNSLYGENKNTSFNAVSREKIIMDIWRVVRPIDAFEPEAGDVPAPITLKVYVVDPSVISVDWSLDGELIATDGGAAYDVAAAGLATGTHVITARAYDNADDNWVRARSGRCIDEAHCWNRDAWKNSEQSVTWSVNVP